jgi:hypothetical protein
VHLAEQADNGLYSGRLTAPDNARTRLYRGRPRSRL